MDWGRSNIDPVYARQMLIGFYLGSTGVTSAYGAAGSLVTILLWVFYSSLIFLLGAEFTQGYASTYGSGVVPAAHAETSPAASDRKNQSQSPWKRSA